MLFGAKKHKGEKKAPLLEVKPAKVPTINQKNDHSSDEEMVEKWREQINKEAYDAKISSAVEKSYAKSLEKKDDLYCLICGEKVDTTGFKCSDFGVCPMCKKESMFLSDASKWFYIEGGKKYERFNFLNEDRSGSVWVEVYANKTDFLKLCELLHSDKEVEIIDDHTDSYRIKYIRGGHRFEITHNENVDVWIDPWWDGESFISIDFVKKDNPSFASYEKELRWIYSVIR